MEKFWEGFEKQAVTMGWINKKVMSGAQKRVENLPNVKMKDAVEAGSNYVKGIKDSWGKKPGPLGERVSDALKAMNERTHVSDLSERGRQNLREGVHMVNKSFPKAK